MLPRLRTSFEKSGVQGIALLGPSNGKPDRSVQGVRLSVGLHVHLYERNEGTDAEHGYLHVDGIVAGWDDKHQCWFATYDWDALTWTREMEGMTDEIQFDDWVAWVFDRPVPDPGWPLGGRTDWNVLTPSLSLEYLRRLFEESGELLRQFSDAQVNKGVFFCIDPGFSDYAFSLLDRTLLWAPRLRCVRSILRLFEFFAARCSPHLSHLDELGANPLNSICYMFWDILPIYGHSDEPAFANLDHALLAVMTETLRLPCDACREGALHGLGHWQSDYPNEVQQIIDRFLAENPMIRPELRRYAESARWGCVQ